MNIDKHLKAIESGTFLMVSHGECYFTQIVKGSELIKQIMITMCGDPDEENWPEGEKEFYQAQVNDPDNWRDDPDCGPTMFKIDIGETDHIELFLITDP